MTAASQGLPTPAQDERIMAALAHVSILIPLMGVILPAVIWITQKDKSRYVAFQALQALALQFVALLGWFAGMACYMASFLGIFISLPFSGSSSGGIAPTEFMFTLPFAILGLMLLAGAALMVYGLAAALMTLQGRDFRYAVVGSQVERFLQR